jgi:hypothetical protein
LKTLKLSIHDGKREAQLEEWPGGWAAFLFSAGNTPIDDVSLKILLSDGETWANFHAPPNAASWFPPGVYCVFIPPVYRRTEPKIVAELRGLEGPEQ